MPLVAPPPGRPRLLFLDTLRGVAILVVLFHTAGHVVDIGTVRWDGPWRTAGPGGWATYSLALGWAGLSLFFVLSGYVIHFARVTDPAAFSVRGFLARRFWRIVPPYWLALAAFHLFTARGGLTDADNVRDLAAHAALVHNFWPATLLGVNPSFWSLAVEWQLYLLSPAFLVLRGRYGVAGALGLVAAVGLLWRVWLLSHMAFAAPITAVGTAPPAVWVDWCLGAYLAERHLAGKRAFPASPVGLAGVFLVSTVHTTGVVFAFSLASLFAASVVDRARFAPGLSRPARFAPLAWLGTISYSVYLWHQPLPDVLRAAWPALTPSTAALLSLPAALGVGWLSYRVIERGSVRAGQWCAGRSTHRPAPVSAPCEGAGNTQPTTASINRPQPDLSKA